MGSRANISLTDRQRAIIIGKILGDGCLEKNGNHTRLKIAQCQKQKDYVLWLYDELASVTPSKPLQTRVNTRGKLSIQWRFATYSCLTLDSIRSMFYNGTKVIPVNIDELLTDNLSLAVWYMDDGYKRTDCSGLYLCTSSFSDRDHDLLRSCLKHNFGLETNIHYAGDIQGFTYHLGIHRSFVNLYGLLF